MALSQSGANYRNRAHVQSKDQLLARALDDIVSQTQAVAGQTNASVTGKTSPPGAPQALSIVNQSGLAVATITHNNAPSGVAHVIQYSSTPNFVPGSTVTIDNGMPAPGVTPTWSQFLQGQGPLYFRTAARFYTTGLSPWVYFGTAQNPTSVTF